MSYFSRDEIRDMWLAYLRAQKTPFLAAEPNNRPSWPVRWWLSMKVRVR